ncbi:MAG: hypothetical protein JW793_07470 [Acidobacteria bacterium]|nr:hypothetical protein [Acidobacteriota bacterium]
MAKSSRKIVVELKPGTGLIVVPVFFTARNGEQFKFVPGAGVAHFAVQFKGLSPLKKAYFSSDKPVKVAVREDAEPGSYPYAIAVTDKSGKIYMDAACPGIGVDW